MIGLGCRLVVVLACWLCASAHAAVTISLSADGGSFVATGVGEGGEFVVRVDGGEDLPAMAGEVTAVDGGGLRFTPRFPLTPGLRYRASIGGTEKVFAIPEADLSPVGRVSAVYPSAEVLPENLLKFYLHFSEPMATGEAASRVHLFGADGEPVALPFLALAEELWDPDGRRLTLFFDPGRVKRGLVPHEEDGRALEAGKDYELRIDAAWRDARGRPLVAGFSKRFRAGAPDYAQPDAQAWEINSPAAGTRDALRLGFGEALDHGLLGRVLRVYDADGRALRGVVEVGEGEREWRWTPDQPWAAGSFRVVVEAILEDLAGNSVARLFEEVGGRKEAWNVRGGRFIRIPFVVAGGKAGSRGGD